jgi:hypothetical protein
VAAGLTRPSALEWLLILVMLGLVWRYFWVMDDAFIYFRYADNLLFLGRGLVFNAGEYVEGFTSPAWMLLLLPFRATHLNYWVIVRGLSVVCAAAYGLGLCAINRALSPQGARVLSLPLAIAAFHYGVTTHFSGGLETPLAQLWSVVLAWWLLRPDSALLAVLAGAAPLIRPELALPAAICAVATCIVRRRWSIAFIASLVVLNGAWLLFRVYYYADLLPNTFYLKAQPNWVQGLWYLACTAAGQYWIWILPASWIGAVWAWRHRSRAQNLAVIAMLASAGVLLLWVTRIGGDMMYYRFVAAPMTLLLCGLGGVVETWLARVAPANRTKGTGLALTALASALSLLAYPPTLTEHPLLHPSTQHFHGIDDAQWHRVHHNLQEPRKLGWVDTDRLAQYATVSHVEQRQLAVLVHPWCKRAFTEYRKYVINSYGLTDAVLARIHAPFGRPGHKAVAGRAAEISRVVILAEAARGPGMYRRAVQQKQAARWMRRNLPTLELIEHKIYNRHRLWENLQYALSPVPRIAL